MKLYTLSFALLFTLFASAQNVGIGTNTPATSAQLDVSSTTKGMLAPRMTTAQRNAIAAPAKGLLVYDTDLNSLYHYNGSGWAAVGSGGGLTLPYEGALNSANPGIKITNSGSGPAIQAITTNEFGYALSASNTTNYGYSVYAYSRSPNAISVYALADSSTGVKGESAKGIGVDAISTDSTALRARIIKGANTDPVILATHAGAGYAVQASSATGAGVYGSSGVQASGLGGVVGLNTNATAGYGVVGIALAAGGSGVYGSSNNGTGVTGYSNSKYGVVGSTISGSALYGNSTTGYGLESVGNLKISGGNTNPVAGAVLTSIDANGNAIWKKQRVGFAVKGYNPNLGNLSKNTFNTIHLYTEEFDYGNNYSVYTGSSPSFGNSVFVAPVSGLYQFDANIQFQNYDADIIGARLDLSAIRSGVGKITLASTACGPVDYPGGSTDNKLVGGHISKAVKLVAGDIVFLECYYDTSSGTASLYFGDLNHQYFSGFLVFEE